MAQGEHAGIVEATAFIAEHAGPALARRLAAKIGHGPIDGRTGGGENFPGASRPAVAARTASRASSTVLSPSAPLPRCCMAASAPAMSDDISAHGTTSRPRHALAALIRPVASKVP
jgi:hypothetical protein